MTNNKTRMTIAILAAALFYSSYAEARSDKLNPQALAKTAAKTALRSAEVNAEVQTFLGNLARGDEYTKQFDQAVSERNVSQVIKLLHEGGLKKSKVTIESGVTSGFRLRIRACLDGISVTITITW